MFKDFYEKKCLKNVINILYDLIILLLEIYRNRVIQYFMFMNKMIYFGKLVLNIFV